MRGDVPAAYRRHVTSRSEHTTRHHHHTGAHRAVTRAHRHERHTPRADRPAAPYEPYLDGLFTYCLSVLCEHDTAVAALGDALAVAERCHDRLRDGGLRRPWLYALARWSCLRRLAGGHPPAGPDDRTPEALAERRRELGALAWPEAAGTTPEQREAIELAVRHQFTGPEIAAVLRVGPETARALLSRAACEVERTRTALSVVERGGCPAVARLAGDTQLLLGATLRRELVRHVDDCPACRRTAEQTVAPGPWPGTATPDVLAVLRAPRTAVDAATAHALDAGPGGPREARTGPHFDRRGFPLDEKDRAARRSLLRHRAVTTTVVAAVVAVPAFALWAAYRHDPSTGEPQGATPVSVNDADNGGSYAYDDSGAAGRTARGATVSGSGSPAPGLPVPAPATSADGVAPSAAPGPPPPAAGPVPGGGPTAPGPGRLTVTAAPQGDHTVITLTDDGGSPVGWSAATDASWLRLSASSGTLQPGQSAAVTVTVDHDTEPAGAWSARVVVDPGGAVVTVEGQGPSPSPTPGPTQSSAPQRAARPRG